MGELYNRFGFELEFSKHQSESHISSLASGSEKTYTLQEGEPVIDRVYLNFDGQKWQSLETKTLSSIARNSALACFTAFKPNDQKQFKLLVKLKKPLATNSKLVHSKQAFFNNLENKHRFVLDAIEPLANEAYFQTDNDKNTPLHHSVYLLKKSDTAFLKAWIELSVSALFNMREQQRSYYFNHITPNIWQKNAQGDTALCLALDEENIPWIQSFYSILVLGEKHSSDWTKTEFQADIKKFKKILEKRIYDIISATELDDDNINNLTFYFKLDLLLNTKFSLESGEKNAFHVARKHNRLPTIIDIFMKAVELYCKDNGSCAQELEQIKMAFTYRIQHEVLNEYNRNINFYIETDPDKNKWRCFQNAYDHAAWHWNFSTEMQSTSIYKGNMVLKAGFDLSNNVVSKGPLYATAAFSFNALDPIFGGTAMLQQKVSEGSAYVGGGIGKRAGMLIDGGAAYIQKKETNKSYYSNTLEGYGKTVGSAAPGAVMTALPWVLAFKFKLASTMFGLAGANAVRYFAPEHTKMQSLFYCLGADLVAFHNFVSPQAMDPHYYEKMQFNYEQFLNKNVAQFCCSVLFCVDEFSNYYKEIIKGFSHGALDSFGYIPGLATGSSYVQAGYNKVTTASSTVINPIIKPFQNFERYYYDIVESSKEFFEKQLLKCLPQNEQCKQRLHFIDRARIARENAHPNTTEEQREHNLEALDEQFKNTIGGKAYEDLQQSYIEQKKLELLLSRLKEDKTVDPLVISENQAALDQNRAHCKTILHTVELHAPIETLIHFGMFKEHLDAQAQEIQAKDALSIQSINNWIDNENALNAASNHLFNLEQDAKSESAAKQQAKEKISQLQQNRDPLLDALKLYNESSVVDSILNATNEHTAANIKLQANVAKANQQLIPFAATCNKDLDKLFGDFQEPRGVYAARGTNYILDILDPLHNWSPKERLAKYTEIHRLIYNEVLYNFEGRGPQKRADCKRKLCKLVFQQVKGCRPPVTDKGLGTTLKHWTNERCYKLFGCEPFQDIAQYTNVSINGDFIIVVGLGVVAPLCAMAFLGLPASVAFGGGSKGAGVGYVLSLSEGKPASANPLEIYGPDASGIQIDINQPVEALKLNKSDPIVQQPKEPSTKETNTKKAPVFVPVDNNIDCGFDDFNSITDLVVPTLELPSMQESNLGDAYFAANPMIFSTPQQIIAGTASYISYCTPEPNTSAVSDDKAKAKAKSKSKATNTGVRPSTATIQTAKNTNTSKTNKTGKTGKTTKTSNENKTSGETINKNKATKHTANTTNTIPQNSKNYTAEVYKLNGGIPSKGMQAGAGASMLCNGALAIGKSIVEGAAAVASLVSEAEKFEQDMGTAHNPSASPKERKAAKKRIDDRVKGRLNSCIRFGKGVSNIISHPIDNVIKLHNKLDDSLTKMANEFDQHLQKGDVWKAGETLSPLVEIAFDAVSLAAGAGAVKGAAKTAAKNTAKGAAKSGAKGGAKGTTKTGQSAVPQTGATKKTQPTNSGTNKTINTPTNQSASTSTNILITGPANRAIIPELNPSVGVKIKPKAYTLGIIGEQPKTGLTTSSITSKIADANLEYSHTVLPLSDVPKTTAFSSAEVSQLKQTDSLCTAAKPHFQNYEHALDTHNYRFPTLHEPSAPPPRFAHVPESRPMVMGEPLPDWVPVINPVLLSQGRTKLSNSAASVSLAPPPCVKMGMESGKISGVAKTVLEAKKKSKANEKSNGKGKEQSKNKDSTPVSDEKKVPPIGPNGIVGKPHPEYPNVYCFSDRICKAHPKHEPTKRGVAAWGVDASINPIRDYAEAQYLLDTAYLTSEKQAFNVRVVQNSNGKLKRQIIRFHHEGQNIWHYYELRKDFVNTMGNDLIDAFLKDGLITAKEHSAYIENKVKKLR